MGTRPACRKVHFLLQVLTSNKNSEWEADLGGCWQICSLQCGVTAADSQGPYRRKQGQQESVQVSRTFIQHRDG